MNRSLIVPAMKRAVLVIALMALSAPVFAQNATEFGVLVGGSRRFVKEGTEDPASRLDSNFSFGNNAIDLYWATEIDSDTQFKIKAGRIETPIAVPSETDPAARQDVEGEVQYLDAIVEYRFEEAYGSTGLFGGAGLYRQSADGVESTRDFGFTAGVNADFPLSKRYGVILEAAYHWPRGVEFQPRYLTVGGGFRIAF